MVLKGLSGDIKSKVERMIDKIGVEVRIERIREIKGGSEKRGKMAVVRLGSEGEKRRTMEKKKGELWRRKKIKKKIKDGL